MPIQEQPPLAATELITALRHADETSGVIGTDHLSALLSLSQVMRQTLQSGRPVELPGIGLFTPHQTGPNVAVKFSLSPTLKAALNPG